MAFNKAIPSVGALALYAMQLAPSVLANPKTCPNDTPLSCSNESTEPSCCFNSPGGALLLTQFWDYDPSLGPSDSWTIHGLWPDNCDGTYEEYCDSSREYSNITAIVEESGNTELLSYMSEYWKDNGGDDESFWEHEWNKHGTCINTIEPSCYANYTPQQEVVDYLQKTVDLFKTLDTYQALADAGITPSNDETYTLTEIHDALAAIHEDFAPYVGCDDSGNLNEAWYFYYVRGNLMTGSFEPAESLTDSSCPESGIKYVPKSGEQKYTTSTHTPTYTPTKTPTHTPTFTPTHTPTFTPTHTPTHTPTSTPLPSFTALWKAAKRA
ncbi:ribonuclease T2-like protein [Aspergillus egyptiacus]|nr:ribonuclease T2-like protein [Aspergillus egyptiacus]